MFKKELDKLDVEFIIHSLTPNIAILSLQMLNRSERENDFLIVWKVVKFYGLGLETA